MGDLGWANFVGATLMPHSRERERQQDVTGLRAESTSPAGNGKTKRLTQAQLVFEMHMKELGLLYQREFKFCSDRKWRADYRIESPKVPCDFIALIEIDGGAFTQGRHTRGKGFVADTAKLNTASGMGYKVFRFTPDQVLRGEAKEFIKRWL